MNRSPESIGESLVTQGKVSGKSFFIEPRYKVRDDLIEQMVTNPSGDDKYPLDLPFERTYDVVGETTDDFFKKHSIAVALINDGRYKNVRFLAAKFVPSTWQETDDEVIALQNDLRFRVREALLKRGDPKETIQAAEELKSFAGEVSKGKTLDANNFRRLVGLFGSSRVVDILYRSRPEFRGIPVDQVKSILADYLGDFLITRGSFNPDDIEAGVDYLSEATFQEGLLEVVKDSCLNFYNFSRRSDPEQQKMDIFQEFFDIISLEIERFDSEELRQVVGRAKDYYFSLLSIPKPQNIVESLREGREFPDVNQLINIKEVGDKRRVVIADEMRLGKSASVILAKEILGVKRALIAAPSNVIPTWMDYLSDTVDNNGRQIGYFKEGQAPKVLIVDSPESLQSEDIDSYDYIIVSHERLNGRYTPLLEEAGFGMLIVDEVHKLKNLQEGVWSSNLLRLSKYGEENDSYVALLSGTPVPNKIEDVALLLKLLYPKQFGNLDNKVLVRSIINGDLVDLRSLLIPRMQMKALRESLRVRDVEETVQFFELSEAEKAIYEVLMEEDEMEARDKMRILRQFVLNPALLETTPGLQGSKIKEVGDYLRTKFLEGKNKIVVFVNGYIENIIRGSQNIIPQLNLPNDVEVRYIMGGISQEERVAVQKDLNNTQKKMAVFISGQTADVGVDFSGADLVGFYNEPWTKYDKMQQTARLLGDYSQTPLLSSTFIASNTLEEGIHLYIDAKYRAIQKLLRGIPISDLEKEMLEKSEVVEEPDLEVNPELAEYYFSTWDKMMKMFGYVREIGEEEFLKFIHDYGKDYAGCYFDLGSRSYQANACRVSGTIIANLAKEEDGQTPSDIRILDIASGPEMLRRHIKEDYQNRIVSLDINRHHFREKGGDRIIGSFLRLPVQDNSMDFVNLSLALHYSRFVPSRGEYERLAVLAEMNRTLKMGGKAVVNLLYNLDIKDLDKFNEIVYVLGFRIMNRYSGEVTVGERFRSRVITLEKVGEVDWLNEEETWKESLGKLAELIGKDLFDGLKLPEQRRKLKDSKRIIKDFVINGETFDVGFNSLDYQVLEEEEEILEEAESLKKQYYSIEEIPADEIISHGFVRFCISRKVNSHSLRKYVLFKKLRKGEGAIVVR